MKNIPYQTFKTFGDQTRKFHDIVWFQTAIFMHDFHHSNLPVAFTQFFLPLNKYKGYNTRSASKLNCFLPHVRTNYGKFSIKLLVQKFGTALTKI